MLRKTSRSRSDRRKGLSTSIWALSIVVLALMGLLALWTARGKPDDAPSEPVAFDVSAPGRLVARETTVDLGRVPFDVKTEARFELANTGGEVVQLVGPPRVRMLEGC